MRVLLWDDVTDDVTNDLSSCFIAYSLRVAPHAVCFVCLVPSCSACMNMCQLVTSMGSSSVEDLQRHLAEASPIPPPDTLCYSFLSNMGPNARVNWPSITVEDRVEECRSHSREVCAEIAAPGVLALRP